MEDVVVIKEKADLTWVYILGGLGGGIILIALCYVCSKCLYVQQKHEEDLIKREKGVVEDLFVKRTPADLVDDIDPPPTRPSYQRNKINKVFNEP